MKGHFFNADLVALLEGDYCITLLPLHLGEECIDCYNELHSEHPLSLGKVYGNLSI
jgi:hypothetical protein